MTGGYVGRILRINLTSKSIGTIDTAKYEEFGGGYGIGAAIFWELAVAPGEWDLQDAFDPRNVVTIMSGPLAATGASSTGRTNVCGIAPSTYPTDIFYRSSFGGRFSASMKFAGWDGIVVEGRAEQPVWINVVNDKVTIEDAKALWGLSTYQTQNKILPLVGGRTRFGEQWMQIGENETTARPQIVCIGPIGEARARVAALVHGSGCGGRSGAFGAVFGAKNLKAISVTGTKGVPVADPKGLVDTRIWLVQNFPKIRAAAPGSSACMPCINNDRGRRDSYYGGESMCSDRLWYYEKGDDAASRAVGAEIATRWGMSTWLTHFGYIGSKPPFSANSAVPGAPALFKKNVPDVPALGWYIKYLYDLGVLGPGKQIDSAPLPMDEWGELPFREAFCDAIAKRAGIGDALAEGTLRAAKKWGRLEEDLQSGALRFPAWGSLFHWSLPGVEWAYGSLMDAGDALWHGFEHALGGGKPGAAKPYRIEQLLEIMSAKTIPYTADPYMFSFAWKGEEAKKTGIYSEHKAKLIAWMRHYQVFWNESMAFCEFMSPWFVHTSRPDFAGPTPEIEMRYYQAVTGKKETFADTMEVGRKIVNLERAIRIVQGRHRDNEKFTPFMYMPGAAWSNLSYGRPVYEEGRWSWQPLLDMYLDDAGVELFKTNFYKLEGWGVDTGWPTRKTLGGLGLNTVADTLASKGKLGA